MVGLTLLIALIVLLILNVPVGIALGVASMFALMVGDTLSLTSIPQA